jgi:cysteine desulfurase family protein
MIYFDNAASGGTKPDAVISAVTSALRVCAKPGRSGHKLSIAHARIVQDCRAELAEFFDCGDLERVIFTKNCTEALNLAIFGCLRKGDHAIVSCMEHNSVLRPLEFLKKSGVITYDICPLDTPSANGNITPENIKKLLKPNTKLVAITCASNVNGKSPLIENIRKILPKNILLLCDGAQGAGHFPISMQKTGIDLLTLAGHKGLYAVQGSGALLFSERVELSPLLYGGTGSMSLSLDMPDFYPDALEAGTLSFPAVVSLLEGVRFLAPRMQSVQSHAFSLTEYCIEQIHDIGGYELFSCPNASGIVAFRHPLLQSEYLAQILSEEYDIAVRGGLHCAPLMHEALHTLNDGLVRVSFSFFNAKKEVDFLLSALRKIEKKASSTHTCPL